MNFIVFSKKDSANTKVHLSLSKATQSYLQKPKIDQAQNIHCILNGSYLDPRFKTDPNNCFLLKFLHVKLMLSTSGSCSLKSRKVESIFKNQVASSFFIKTMILTSCFMQPFWKKKRTLLSVKMVIVWWTRTNYLSQQSNTSHTGITQNNQVQRFRNAAVPDFCSLPESGYGALLARR